MFYGVAYYPEHWPEDTWAADAVNLRQAGMDGVRIGEFAWSKMEPAEGHFEFGWLDRAIEVLGQAGLKVVLGTPSATPPLWFVQTYPDVLPVDANGIAMTSGIRKYYCHTHDAYRRACQRIARELAQRYGANPHVVGWQIDNEFGDHDTVRCYCHNCRNAFIERCRAQFGTLDALNDAWGTVFWNQIYSDWAQIDLPYPRREIGLNPGHLLAYYRFTSAQVIDFARLQIEALRESIAPDQWITTNVIATYWEIDFKALAETLDFISWDCYTVIDAMSPVRQPEVGPSPPIAFPPRSTMVSLVHDLMRSFSHGPFWVMETAGQDRLVAYHTLAHGGDGINFFNWKGPRFGAEQSRGGYEYHGLFSERFYESQRLSAELHRIADDLTKTTYAAQVGLLYSFDMGWAYDIQAVYPRSRWIDGVGYWRLMEEYYAAFWHKNIGVQPVSPDDDWTAYPVLVVPCLYLTTPTINQALCDYVSKGGILIVGPASGTKDWHNAYLDTLPPHGPLKELFGCELIGTGSMGYFGVQAHVTLTDDAPFAAGQSFACKMTAIDKIGFFSATRPVEVLRPLTAQALGHFDAGQVACTVNTYGQGQAIYLGFSPDEAFMAALIEWLTAQGKVAPVLSTPAGVQATRRHGPQGGMMFVVNHNFTPSTVHLPHPSHDLIHNQTLQGAVSLPAQTTWVLKVDPHEAGGEPPPTQNEF